MTEVLDTKGEAELEKVPKTVRKRAKANPEKVREARRKRRESNPEKERERHRKWRKANPEKVREAHRKWQKANPENARKANRKWRKANPEKAREASRKYEELHRGKRRRRRKRSISVLTRIRSAKNRALEKGLAFDLDQHRDALEFRAEYGRCELTGIPFQNGEFGTRTPFTMSIDRIDSNKGYTYNNVRLVCWCVNAALGTWGEDAFAAIAEGYARTKSRGGLI